MMKKLSIILILLILCTACQTDAREIDQRTMILGMGIDITEETGEYIVTLQVPVITPAEGEAMSANQFETISGKGETVWEAITNIESYTPTVLFFGHLKAVLIGERLARQGIDDILDLLDRRAPLANQVYLLVIRSKVEVNDFLSQQSPLIQLPSLYLDRFFNADQKLSRTKEVKLFEYRRDSNMIGNAGTIPLAYSDVNIIIEDMAIFHKGKLVGEFIGKEAGKSELLKKRKLSNHNYTIQLEQNGSEVTVSSRISYNLDINYEKTHPVQITLDIKGKAEVIHISDREFQTTKEHLAEIKERMEEDVKKDLEHTINKVKEINLEPWLIGHKIWASDFDYFESLDWEETGWKNSEITTTVEIEIEQTGQKGVLEKKQLGR